MWIKEKSNIRFEYQTNHLRTLFIQDYRINTLHKSVFFGQQIHTPKMKLKSDKSICCTCLDYCLHLKT